MWHHAVQLGHRALAITDHLYTEDPRPMMERLLQEQAAFEVQGFTTLVGVEISMNPPKRIATAARAARKAGAQIVIVHGETPLEPVPPGTNHASVDSNEIDVLAHPGILTEQDAELARAHNVALELTPRRGHSWGNGLVAALALRVGAELVVDSDAHDVDQLLTQARARQVALGAGVSPDRVARVLAEAPSRLLQRLAKH
jgi:putative hydrolase